MSERPFEPSEREPSPRHPWIQRPLGYLSVAFIAALFSVALFASTQFLYQKFVAAPDASGALGPLDNPAAATEQTPEVDKGLLIRTSNSFRDVTKKVGSAVVSIKTSKQPSGPDRQGAVPFDDPFFKFFERFGAPFPFDQQQRPQMGLGSGIIISKSGYVVTNNHVVEGATEILISPSGKNKDYKAEIVGTDPKTDLAVLKVEDFKDLPDPAEWADSDQVEVGDWAIAIGNPFGLGTSVTVGIISAKGGRNSLALTGAEYVNELLQTDAAINPGNSGGPLCDIEGRVTGVNTAIYTRSGGYMGIGFAIPSNLAKDIVDRLIKEGKVIRGWLGVYIQPLQEDLAKELGVTHGVGVHEVISDSPAEKGGLRAGDVIVEVDGKSINEVPQLQSLISRKKPGQLVHLKVVSYSDKKERAVRVEIGELPGEGAGPRRPGPGAGQPDRLGLVVAPTKQGDGVLVEMVRPGSLAAQIGLEAGDVILRVNRRVVKNVQDYRKAVQSARRLYMEVRRKGRRLFFQFSVPRE